MVDKERLTDLGATQPELKKAVDASGEEAAMPVPSDIAAELAGLPEPSERARQEVDGALIFTLDAITREVRAAYPPSPED